MLDVFVVGLIVLTIKGLPGGSRVTLGWGVAAFAASVVLSLIAGIAIHRLERRTPQPDPAPQPEVAPQPA